MLKKAEKDRKISPGDTLIEPTSGNTGIGLALAGAVKGYRVIITMPEKMSKEKQVILEALGAKIIRTPTEAAWDSPESHISVALRLQKELPNAHILDQYANPENPKAHYEGTAQEILDDLDGKVDMLIIGAGTGGTISGCAKKIKEHNPKCLIIGVDPVGSILAGDGPISTYKVEGIGYDFIPKVLDKIQVDRWVKSNDRQSFLLSRRLIRDEGLLCGGSSGAALYAALQEAKQLKKDQNCVIILPDGVRNYLSKFIDDKWMVDNNFKEKSSLQGSLADYKNHIDKKEINFIDVSSSPEKAIEIMREKGFSQIPITKDKTLIGMLHEKNLLDYLVSSHQKEDSLQLSDLMSINVQTVSLKTPIKLVQDLILASGSVVIINQKSEPINILTKIDLVDWIYKKKN